MEPITIPAIAPPDNPLWELDAAGVDVADGEIEEVGDEVAELVGKLIKAVIVGNTTPAHLCSALEL